MKGEYDYVHDWESNPTGEEVLDQRGLSG